MKLRRRMLGVAVSATALAAVTVPAASMPAQALGNSSRHQVIDYLKAISGRQIVAGVEDKDAGDNGNGIDLVHQQTGRYPGMWGGDVGLDNSTPEGRHRQVQRAEEEWRGGTIPTMSWHMCPPTKAGPCGYDDVFGKAVNDPAIVQKTLQPGTKEHALFLADLDGVADQLQQLRLDDVPLLFRPVHEMNDNWSWWGGHTDAKGSAALYRTIHDHLVKDRKLTNLVWVWNVDDNCTDRMKQAKLCTTSEASERSLWQKFYPGNAYVDVVSTDSYTRDITGDPAANKAEYDDLHRLGPDKPAAVAEAFKVPSTQLLDELPKQKWTYLLTWPDELGDPAAKGSSWDDIRYAYDSDWRVLTQGNITLGSH